MFFPIADSQVFKARAWHRGKIWKRRAVPFSDFRGFIPGRVMARSGRKPRLDREEFFPLQPYPLQPFARVCTSLAAVGGTWDKDKPPTPPMNAGGASAWGGYLERRAKNAATRRHSRPEPGGHTNGKTEQGEGTPGRDTHTDKDTQKAGRGRGGARYTETTDGGGM